MALYEPNIHEFFSKFNTSVVKEFKFDQINMNQQEEKEEAFTLKVQSSDRGSKRDL